MNGDLETALRQLLKSVVREVVAELRDEERTLNRQPASRATAGEDGFLLTTRETAKRLAISERHLFELTRTGKLPCVRVGRNVRYSVETIRKWVRDTESTDQPTAAEAGDRTKLPTKSTASTSTRRRPQASERLEAEQLDEKSTQASRRQPRKPTHSNSQTSRQEGEKWSSPFTALLSEIGIEENLRPATTNGELMRIAEVDIPTFHGWMYLNRPLPEEAIFKLKNHFRRLAAEQQPGA
jgi:excisionase family DNA binding protein